MDAIYAMQRANGDCFVHLVNERLSMPLFHTVHDALMSRLKNFAMLMFKPVKLTPVLLKKVISQNVGAELSYSVIEDPFESLGHAALIDRNELCIKTNCG